MLVSSVYFRTHTNVGLPEEVPEECNNDDDDDDDDIASQSHTPSPSLSTSSAVSKRKKKSCLLLPLAWVSAKSPTLAVAASNDTSDLCAMLRKFIASRENQIVKAQQRKSN
jgi:hypothetical protein